MTARTRDPRTVFEALVEGVGAGRWEQLADLYADDVVVRHPFDVGPSAVLTGRDAVHGHFQAMAARGLRMRARDIVVHRSVDPEVVIAQFTYAVIDADGTAFSLPAIFVVRVRDGLIVSSDDYLGSRR